MLEYLEATARYRDRGVSRRCTCDDPSIAQSARAAAMRRGLHRLE
jgi:hypothetical protein